MGEDIVDQWPYQIDHAAKNETSILMYLYPDLVNKESISTQRALKGVNGEHPIQASAEYGKMVLEKALDLLKDQLLAI